MPNWFYLEFGGEFEFKNNFIAIKIALNISTFSWQKRDNQFLLQSTLAIFIINLKHAHFIYAIRFTES